MASLANGVDNTGHENLVASHPGNTSRLMHGVYSGRVLGVRAAEVTDALMTMPHTHPLDRLAAEEIGSIVAALEAIDRDIDRRGVPAKARSNLMEIKKGLTRELRSWLQEFGGTPRSRADWAAQLGRGSLADQVRKRLDAVDGR